MTPRVKHFSGKIVLVSLLLCAALTYPAHAAKRKSGLGVQILEKAALCPEKAKVGDNLKLHYVGKLKDGIMFDETFKVGRPVEVVLGSGQNMQGWEEGLPGMCVGELRRLTVPAKLSDGGKGAPPGATLIYEITLVALNNKYEHDIQREAEKELEEEEARTKAADLVLAENVGDAVSPFCDACNTFVEEFFESWVVMLSNQRNNVEQKKGGSEAPALTYNDDVEASVQGFCNNKTTSRMSRPVFAAHIKPACDRIMLGHKREIVGKFLATELQGRNIPDKKDVVCADMVRACPHSGGKVEHTDCGFCQAAIQDIAFEVRRSATWPAITIEKKVYEIMGGICMNTYYRHRYKSSDLQEACDDMLDEHPKEIANNIIKGVNGELSWQDVERSVCVDLRHTCSDSLYKDEL